jgi:hypothetical protein
MDSEIRTIHAAEVASVAFFGGYCMWGMVSLGIKGIRKCEHLAWTELNAETTGFTSFNHN